MSNKTHKRIENKKIRVSALIAFITSILFAIINFFIGIYFKSIFPLSIGIYYTIFVLITGIILGRFYKRAHFSAINLYFWSNITLLVLDTSLIIPIILMLTYQQPINLPIWVFIVYACYTVYKITYAVISYTKHKRNNNVLFTELKTIGIIDAALSVLTLGNLLIETFVKNQLSLSANYIFLICGVIIIVAMIVWTSISFYRGLKLIKEDKHYKHIDK